MTRPESAVAIAERALAIEGSVSPSALRRVDENGDFAADPATAALFVSFAFADLPIGWTFSHVWSVDGPSEMQEVDGTIDACTQQFDEPLEEWAYIRDWHTDTERTAAYDNFVHFYNHHRSHGALGWSTPMTVLEDNVTGQHN